MEARSGQRSELVHLRKENTKYFLNEDGTTTAEIHGGPVHFRDGAGRWADFDSNLVPDGRKWRNRAGPFQVELSNTADPTTTATVRADGMSVSFGAPGTNRVPVTVAGSRAVYRGVAKNTDLSFEASSTSLKELIILRRPPTEPITWRIPLNVAGGLVPVQREDNGPVDLQSPDGETVFTIPAMWMADSDIGKHSDEGSFSDAIRMQLQDGAGGYSLLVEPDHAWLTNPARVYPVEIDPTVSRNTSFDTFVQSNIVNTAQGSSTELKAGTYDGGKTKARSLFKFNDIATDFGSKEIISGKFSIYEKWSWSCSARPLLVQRVTSSWGSGTLWSTQPTVASTALATVNTAKGYSSSCPAGRVVFDVTNAVANWADKSWDNYGLRLRAEDEGDNYGWKKFASVETSHNPVLEVQYNTRPGVPTGRSPESGVRSNDTTPTFRATYQDDDAGDAGYVDFRMLRDGSVVRSGRGPASSSVADGTSVSWTPSALSVDDTYQWQVRSCDGRLCSSWSSSWNYVLDKTAPPIPTITAKPIDPSNGSSPAWSFSGVSGSTFQCELTRSGTVVSAFATCTSPRSYSLSAQPDGVYTFRVRQKDSVGNLSSSASDSFTLDRTLPAAPVITDAPANPSNDDQPMWDFAGETKATFLCELRLDGQVVTARSACAPATAFDLSVAADGVYEFRVWQRDAAGNLSSAYRSSSYRLDREAPAPPTITVAPEDPLQTWPTWEFTGSEPNVTFECELIRDETVVFDAHECSSPVSFDLQGEPDGVYALQVSQLDAAANTSEIDGTEFWFDRPCAMNELSVMPLEDLPLVGSEAAAVATVRDLCHDSVAAGETVSYTVTGTQTSSGTLTTDDTGVAYVELTGVEPGFDRVEFSLAAVPGQAQEVVVEWRAADPEPPPADRCDVVDVNSDGTIAPSSPCDVSGEEMADPGPTETEGPCAGLYEIGDTGVCTHGPDLLPEATVLTDDAPPPTDEEEALPMPETGDAENEAGYDEATDPDYQASVSTSAETDYDYTAAATRGGDPLCRGDGVSGARVQLVYAVKTDSRYLSVKDNIRVYAHRANRVFFNSSAENRRRRIRYVCNKNDRISVRKVVVPKKVDVKDMGAIFHWLRTDDNPPAGMRRRDRKYLLYVDGVKSSPYCGLGESTDDPRKNSRTVTNGAEFGFHPDWPDAHVYGRTPAYGGVWLNQCAGWPRHNSAPGWHNTEAHELVHLLGGVNYRAPHGTKNGHCWDEKDVMCYDDSGASRDDDIVKVWRNNEWVNQAIVTKCARDYKENRLDCRKDDYFNSRRNLTGYLSRRWNVADSRFLIKS